MSKRLIIVLICHRHTLLDPVKESRLNGLQAIIKFQDLDRGFAPYLAGEEHRNLMFRCDRGTRFWTSGLGISTLQHRDTKMQE
jgi:hypothetical protein